MALSPEYRTTGFSPNMALTALPKLMNTMIVLVMDGGLTASIKALTGYFAFHRLLLAFIELYPQLMVEVNNSITEFIKNENARVKSEIPSIGDWIPLISVSNKYTWHHVAKAVIGETFDRNVIWICKQDPTLATLADVNKANQNNNNANTKPGVEQHRLDKSFEASLVSQKLILFHVYFLTRVARPPGTSLVQVADNYDRYFGRPNSRELVCLLLPLFFSSSLLPSKLVANTSLGYVPACSQEDLDPPRLARLLLPCGYPLPRSCGPHHDAA